LPAMRETWVRFLGWEDPLEKEMAIHSSTLAWKIPWMEEPDRLQSVGGAESRTRLSDFTSLHFQGVKRKKNLKNHLNPYQNFNGIFHRNRTILCIKP